MAPIRQFLILYDRRRGELVVDPPQVFDNEDDALEAYRRAEEDGRSDPNVEVVLVGADSLDTVRQTHSNYFGDDLEKLLAGV
jgi:hypothetical protein